MDFLKNWLIVTVCLKFCRPISALLILLSLCILLVAGLSNMYETLGSIETITTIFVLAIIPGLLFGYCLMIFQHKIGKWYYKKHPEQPRPAWWKSDYES